MHIERYALPAATCEAINRASRQRRRVIAVGTTTTRVLESQPAGDLVPHEGQTQLLISPPYAFKRVDALITNFHQPRSTLIALVAAFMGLDEQRRAYASRDRGAIQILQLRRRDAHRVSEEPHSTLQSAETWPFTSASRFS